MLKALYFTLLYKALQAYNIDSKFFRLEEGFLALAALLANPSANLQVDKILELVSYYNIITGLYYKE